MNQIETIELGIPNLLRTILWLAAIYYVSKFLFRWWLKKKVAQKVDEYQNSVSDFEAQQKRHEQGRVTVHQTNSKKSASSNDGEYVDFEEVD